ncbi:hypothetical protein [Haliangium ochraceum]|uniref:Uncharacterized protein n=1 Tax=Haliangium ochraceum (strain DSM 14365 / JCM 11303 / SMP-2) TaxID=502025 RepID=D0LLV0_HALO1|nr:hypothetical protein [Haliangium ochraceum]ACY15128.1 conserved hypothetical protein [Haliangium ochraceum DSM 14365]
MQGAVQPGLKALQKRDRKKVQAQPADCVSDSVALDETYTREQPNESRWDYVVGVKEGEHSLVAIEVHPVTAGEVRSLIKKKAWAKKVMSRHLVHDKHIKRWVWVASGEVGLTKTSSEFRRLATAGIELAGRELTLP